MLSGPLTDYAFARLARLCVLNAVVIGDLVALLRPMHIPHLLVVTKEFDGAVCELK